jgi:apolipoprotein N-acyltransferase
MVEWIAFAQVAVATVVAAVFIVFFYGLGVRLQAVAEDEHRNRALHRAGAWACFCVCGIAVLFGIALIVPQISHSIGL